PATRAARSLGPGRQLPPPSAVRPRYPAAPRMHHPEQAEPALDSLRPPLSRPRTGDTTAAADRRPSALSYNSADIRSSSLLPSPPAGLLCKHSMAGRWVQTAAGRTLDVLDQAGRVFCYPEPQEKACRVG